jgi:hypothetical protein
MRLGILVARLRLEHGHVEVDTNIVQEMDGQGINVSSERVRLL